MNSQPAILAFIAIIIALVLIGIFAIAEFAEKKDSERNACKKYNCPSIANYIGSADSKEFYSCSCSSIPEIEEENKACFISALQAEEKGYKRVEC